MSDVKVATGEVQLRTCKLTRSLLKQIRQFHYFNDVRPYLPGGSMAKGDEQPVLGWVHGTVLDPADEFGRWLIIMVGQGDYRRYRGGQETCSQFPQLYVI